MRGVLAAHNSAYRNALPNLNDANYLMAARQQVRFADFERKLFTHCDHETHLLWEGQAKLAEICPGYNVNVATICGSR
jgi:hypothetical protein